MLSLQNSDSRNEVRSGGESLPPKEGNDMKTTVEAKGKGHFEVEYTDGKCGNAFYDCTLEEVMKSIMNQIPYRTPKSISWVED